MGALWMGMFVALIALALDTFMIGTAKMHQSSTVEYIALGTLRTLKEPPADGSYIGSNEVDRYNFAINRGALAGAANLPGSSAAQVMSSEIQVRLASGQDDSDEDCGQGGGGPPGGGPGLGSCSENFNDEGGGACGGIDQWCGFESSSPIGSVIFGVYTPASGATAATFVPAAAGASVGGINAVKVRLQLQDPNISKFVLPFGKVLLGDGAVKFQSTAIAIIDAPGKYRLVR
jgi:hypothetical protein